MIFHEIYSVYYQTVAKILEEALDHPLKQDEICNIIEKYAFSESILSIESALREKMAAVKVRGTTIFKNDSIYATYNDPETMAKIYLPRSKNSFISR